MPLRRPLVGTPGFEPGTSCTPSKHATRLRHVPSDLWYLAPSALTNRILAPGLGPAQSVRIVVAVPISAQQPAQRDPLGVLLRQVVRIPLREPGTTQLEVEPANGTAAHARGSERHAPQRPDESENQPRGADTRDHSSQLDPRSRSLRTTPPRSIPLPRMRSRRLIMYPRAMSIASSRGIPASTSFL